MIVQSFCAEDTYEIGKKIGQEAQPGQVICLYGDLGLVRLYLQKGWQMDLVSQNQFRVRLLRS